MYNLKNEEDIIGIIGEDRWMMEILKTAKSLNLPDWWICAGFVRSKIWDVLHGFPARTPLADIDVIYFDPSSLDENVEKEFERILNSLMPTVPWSVKNQARMHLINNLEAYTSAVDGISKFPETVTSLGVKLDEKDKIILTAPWGIQDVLSLHVRPMPLYLEKEELKQIYLERLEKKKWERTWNKIRIDYLED